MLKHSDLEYLKRVNGIRKKLGVSLDINKLTEHSFLNNLFEAASGGSNQEQVLTDSGII